ncbi:MAG: HAD hydrolase-like protein [Anaerolineaceae bacterium]|nr:HAD hydrolase-like protein [Anaerolineaceae bacterium]
MSDLPIDPTSKATPLTTLVFDWGDTLMRDYPEYTGVMVDWPVVTALDGVQAALDRLQGRYHMVVATNALESTSHQVAGALRRVQLDAYFEAFYTFHELGERKPQPGFYRAIERRAPWPAGGFVMIGDTYTTDILGAAHAGWRAVWYNPQQQFCPGMLPYHDAEIDHFSQLPAALEHTPLPSLTLCYHWLAGQNASHLLLQHVQTVAAIAYGLAVLLRRKDVGVDPILAHRGGLLHDLAKLSARRSMPGLDHGAAAAALLQARGLPDLAEIANRHMLYCLVEPQRKPLTWEQKLVYLADKMVEGAQLVDPQARIRALQGRYPEEADQIAQTLPALEQLLQELCERLSQTPTGLLDELKTILTGR